MRARRWSCCATSRSSPAKSAPVRPPTREPQPEEGRGSDCDRQESEKGPRGRALFSSPALLAPSRRPAAGAAATAQCGGVSCGCRLRQPSALERAAGGQQPALLLLTLLCGSPLAAFPERHEARRPAAPALAWLSLRPRLRAACHGVPQLTGAARHPTPSPLLSDAAPEHPALLSRRGHHLHLSGVPAPGLAPAPLHTRP